MMFVKYKITDLFKGKLHFSNYVAYHSYIFMVLYYIRLNIFMW